MKTQLSRAVSLLAAVSLLWATPAAAALYTPADLGTLGGSYSEAHAVNGAGVIVGSSTLRGDSEKHATVWFQGRITDLGTLAVGRSSAAYGVSNNGLVVGVSDILSDYHEHHAVLWDHGTMIDLGTLSGGRVSEAHAVNNAGQVVGASQFAGPTINQHAFLWQNGTMTDLAPQSASSLALDINRNGQIVGHSCPPENPVLCHATLWQNGQMIDLGAGYARSSFATAINDLGQVVGYIDAGDRLRAVTWINGQMTILPAWARAGSSFAYDINNNGEIVGTMDSAGGASRPVLWKAGRIIDLGTPSGQVAVANAINGAGVIVGNSYFGSYNYATPHATRWTK